MDVVKFLYTVDGWPLRGAQVYPKNDQLGEGQLVFEANHYSVWSLPASLPLDMKCLILDTTYIETETVFIVPTS